MSKSTLRRLGKTMPDNDALDFLVDYFPCVSNLKAQNAELLDVVRDCVNFLADLKTKPFYIPGHLSDRAKALHKRAYTAHSKAKEK